MIQLLYSILGWGLIWVAALLYRKPGAIKLFSWQYLTLFLLITTGGLILKYWA